MKLTQDQLMFLRDLLSWGGIASSADLRRSRKPTHETPTRIRAKCKSMGLVEYDGGAVGYWRITDAGRRALAEQEEKNG